MKKELMSGEHEFAPSDFNSWVDEDDAAQRMKVRDELGISEEDMFIDRGLTNIRNVTAGFRVQRPEGKVAWCLGSKCPDLKEFWAKMKELESDTDE